MVKLNPYSRLNFIGLVLEMLANALLIVANKMIESVVVMCVGIVGRNYFFEKLENSFIQRMALTDFHGFQLDNEWLL